MEKVRQSLWVIIIVALSIIVVANVLGIIKGMAAEQVIRICSLLAGAIIGSAAHAICKMNELTKNHTRTGEK